MKRCLGVILCLCFTIAFVNDATAYSFEYKTATLEKTWVTAGYLIEYRFDGNVLGKTGKLSRGTLTIVPVRKGLERVGQVVTGKYVKNGFLVTKQTNLTNDGMKVNILSGQVCFYWSLEGEGTPVNKEFVFNWVSLWKNRCLTPEGIYTVPIKGYDTEGWFLTPSLHWEWAVLNGVYGGTDVWLKKEAGWAFYYYPQLVSMVYMPLLAKTGVIYTQPSCTYLGNLYGFGAGFYDTRFNTDCADFLVEVGQSVGEPTYLWATGQYKDYLLRHSVSYFWKIGDGILVADYSWVGSRKITHASLNHNLQEINFLLRLGDGKGFLLAQQILKGIIAGGDSWIAPNGDLNYGYYGHGKYYGKDYEGLTLGDLKITKSLLFEYGWGIEYSSMIEKLIIAKENFLDK